MNKRSIQTCCLIDVLIVDRVQNTDTVHNKYNYNMAPQTDHPSMGDQELAMSIIDVLSSHHVNQVAVIYKGKQGKCY